MKIQDIREEIKAQNLDLFGVCEWLEQYGSDQDPIIYMGQEMEARDPAYKLAAYTPALSVRISFWGAKKGGGHGLRRNSNFAHMLKDRIDMFAEREREKKKQERKPVVEYIVTWLQYTRFDHANTEAKTFTNRAEAKSFFVQTKRHHYGVKFRKVTDELLGESDD